MWPISVVLLVAGVVLMAVALPLVRGRVPPNRFYGVRVPTTLANERAWYSANARVGRDFIVYGGTLVVTAIAVPILFPKWPPPRFIHLGVAELLTGVVVIGIRTFLLVRALARRNSSGPSATSPPSS